MYTWVLTNDWMGTSFKVPLVLGGNPEEGGDLTKSANVPSSCSADGIKRDQFL